MIAHVWAMLAAGRRVRRPDQPAERALQRGRRGLLLPGGRTSRCAAIEPRLRLAGAAAGALLGAFTFTNWQNSNETEVYAVATFTIAADVVAGDAVAAAPGSAGRRPAAAARGVSRPGCRSATICWRCSRARRIVAFLAVTLRTEPAADPACGARNGGRWRWWRGCGRCSSGPGSAARRWSCWGRSASSTAAAFAARGGSGTVRPGEPRSSPRSGSRPTSTSTSAPAQHPPINEAAPATFDALLAVIRRAQYPPRTPLDDPTLPSGAAIPAARSACCGVQLMDYAVWFDWQWAKALRGTLGPRARADARDARVRVPRAPRPVRAAAERPRRRGGCCSCSGW